MYARRAVPVHVIGYNSVAQWSEVFDHNPKIIRKPVHGAAMQVLQNGPGMRPYISYKTPKHWVWKRFSIEPGEMYFSDEELRFAEPYRGSVLIEPNTKVKSGNKAWVPERWQQLVDGLGYGTQFVQAGPYETQWLNGVTTVATTFRYAAAVLSVCRAFVGTEGALHHAAAAFGVPAVVLYSEFITPEITGYTTQRNIRHAGVACGARLPCAGCRRSMEAISVEEVMTNLKEIA